MSSIEPGGVLLFGDMPIYVHLESADVWAHQALFDLDEQGQPVTVTGVPPDYFSEEGQLWGNPQYNWQRMQDNGFDWWLQRFGTAARQFDIVRIDHFRALVAHDVEAQEAQDLGLVLALAALAAVEERGHQLVALVPHAGEGAGEAPNSATDAVGQVGEAIKAGKAPTAVYQCPDVTTD